MTLALAHRLCHHVDMEINQTQDQPITGRSTYTTEEWDVVIASVRAAQMKVEAAREEKRKAKIAAQEAMRGLAEAQKVRNDMIATDAKNGVTPTDISLLARITRTRIGQILEAMGIHAADDPLTTAESRRLLELVMTRKAA